MFLFMLFKLKFSSVNYLTLDKTENLYIIDFVSSIVILLHGFV